MTPTWEIREGDALEQLRAMPDESVQCCVTSPPYFGLRDYGVAGQIGLEATLDEFLDRLLDVFAEVGRALRSDGTLWVNIGDSYASKPRGSDNGWDKSRLSNPARVQKAQSAALRRSRHTASAAGAKQKDLMGVPWLFALAMRDAGWWLRSDIIWAKPSPMPESVTDRPTRSHEYLFLFTKRPTYYYDAEAIREPDKGLDHARQVLAGQPSLEPSGGISAAHKGLRTPEGRDGLGRNRRTVWEIAGQPFPDAHFATFPPKLVEPCILAGSSPAACGECGAPRRRLVDVGYENPGNRTTNGPRSIERRHLEHGSAGYAQRLERRSETVGWEPTCEHDDASGRCVVLDPFAGAATTGLVALRCGRSFIGVELSPAYCEMARERIRRDAPLLNTPAEVAA